MKNPVSYRKSRALPRLLGICSWGLLALLVSCQTTPWQPAASLPADWSSHFVGDHGAGSVKIHMQKEGRLEDHAVLDWIREWHAVRADVTDPLGRSLLYLSWAPQEALSIRGGFSADVAPYLTVEPSGALQWRSHYLGCSLWELAAFLEGRLPHEWQLRTIQVTAPLKYAMVKVQDDRRDITLQFLPDNHTRITVAWSIWWGLRTQQIHIDLDPQGGRVQLPDGNTVAWMVITP